MIKKIGLGLIVLLAVLQIIPSNKPEVKTNNPDDLLITYAVPEDIGQVLKVSCYDCHSNQTNYPWYSYVAPVSFLVAQDVRKGRKHLNFSEWNSLSKLNKLDKLDDINEAVEGNEMPMGIYTAIHTKAKLTIEQKNRVLSWTDEFGETIFDE